MQVSDFNFELPPELIAQAPLAHRTDSRLLCLDRNTGARSHHTFRELGSLLRAGDLLVFNDTRVIQARLFGSKDTGGRVELLIERVTDACRALAQIRASKSPKAGTRIRIDGSRASLTVVGREGQFFDVSSTIPVATILEEAGHIPLPPYIERAAAESDAARYQTVYAREAGAVAAPTAGLHFDEALLGELSDRDISRTFVTLHVGAGTFQPVRVDSVEAHQMHSERFHVPEGVCEAVAACRARGGRVIAVGTTSVRSLESAAAGGTLVPTAPAGDETAIFIYPGYRFRVVDGLITNFHLPGSTLIMLVAAFAGLDPVRAAYAEAIASRYRFFSYGDAMLILGDVA